MRALRVMTPTDHASHVPEGQGMIATGSTNVFFNGAGAVRVGDRLQDHDSHVNLTMLTGSSSVFVNGSCVCREGDVTIPPTDTMTGGSDDVNIGG